MSETVGDGYDTCVTGWTLGLEWPERWSELASGPSKGQGVGGGTRTCDRRIPADLRAGSLSTVPPHTSGE
ncbi:hypothetical protein PoB_001902200 [Plakobranchus ocellatus]|uniref:Uncharacterized protein n=1 Tax=Plakobranchus ocellatus TaxID=259542 RepID=A0AAV3ZDH4_9GAST|nr:hypothetical protein PoB_001902200 [Plakobranchus ocellatus]